jgi:hypothetical protein
MKESAHRPLLCMTSLLAVAAIAAAVFSSLFAQNVPPGSPSIGAYPAGPGGRDTPMQPTPRPNPLPPFYDPKLPVSERVQNIVSMLSLEEKVALMQMASPSIPRLGIVSRH